METRVFLNNDKAGSGAGERVSKCKSIWLSTALFTLYIFVFLLTEFTVNNRSAIVLGAEQVVLVYAVGIVCTSLGYIAFAISRGVAKTEENRRIFIVVFAMLFMMMTFAFLRAEITWLFVLSALLSLFCFGYIGGFAHYSVSLFLLDKRYAGRVIGVSIAFATLMQYAVQNLSVREAILVSSIFVSVVGIICLALKPVKDWMFENPLPYASSPTLSRRQLVAPVAAVAIMSLCFGLGDGLVTWLHASGTVNLSSYTRLMYALGILAAGFLADIRSRMYLPLATLCMLMLTSAMALFLNETGSGTNELYMVQMYLFAGFYVMYLTVSFTDIAPRTERAELWAGMGRIVRGPFIAMTSIAAAPLFRVFGPQGIAIVSVCLSLVVLVLFVYSGALNFQGAAPLAARGDAQETMAAFAKAYGLTPRESDIFELLMDSDMTNKDISARIYISQRVLERYVSSIYEKTDVKSRIQLINKYYMTALESVITGRDMAFETAGTGQANHETLANVNLKTAAKAAQGAAGRNLVGTETSVYDEYERNCFDRAAAKYSLTPREAELLVHFYQEKRNDEIAEELGISESTVKFHLKNIMRKLNVKNRKELQEIVKIN